MSCRNYICLFFMVVINLSAAWLLVSTVANMPGNEITVLDSSFHSSR